jgi:hypothetical protein
MSAIKSRVVGDRVERVAAKMKRTCREIAARVARSATSRRTPKPIDDGLGEALKEIRDGD